jgi:hypothetical protein
VTDYRAARLRVNPRFRLLSFDQISEQDKPAFASLTRSDDFYGVLIPPPDSSLPPKSLSRDAALLLLTLREPACIPQLLDSLFGRAVNERVRELLLDGICEIEKDGVFVSGSRAVPVVDPAVTAAARVAQLSLDAITYAASLRGLSAAALGFRLYMYNRTPITSKLSRRFLYDADLLSFLFDDKTNRQLEKQWRCDTSNDAWLIWRHAEAARSPFKLYVSPTLNCAPETFRAAVGAFQRVNCAQFKFGRGAAGVARPDKFVAYFATLDQLRAAAELIKEAVSGVSAQGVPFTAAIDTDGLLSWGMDPPRLEQVLPWQEFQSWRQWIASRVAVYTLAAVEGAAEDVGAYVLQRVGLDGIEPTTWRPSLTIWQEHAHSAGNSA